MSDDQDAARQRAVLMDLATRVPPGFAAWDHQRTVAFKKLAAKAQSLAANRRANAQTVATTINELRSYHS